MKTLKEVSKLLFGALLSTLGGIVAFLGFFGFIGIGARITNIFYTAAEKDNPVMLATMGFALLALFVVGTIWLYHED